MYCGKYNLRVNWFVGNRQSLYQSLAIWDLKIEIRARLHKSPHDRSIRLLHWWSVFVESTVAHCGSNWSSKKSPRHSSWTWHTSKYVFLTRALQANFESLWTLRASKTLQAVWTLSEFIVYLFSVIQKGSACNVATTLSLLYIIDCVRQSRTYYCI